VAVTCLVSLGLFAVPLRGSVALLFLTTSLFLLGAMGFGIFLSALLKSQLLASQASLMSTYLPAILLSGFIFAIDNMPRFLQIFSLIVPARYFVEITRGIFLKGVGLDVLWPETLGLLIYTTIGVGLAVRVFRKEIA
jgi:ABC-2 type transport system permease protein